MAGDRAQSNRASALTGCRRATSPENGMARMNSPNVALQNVAEAFSLKSQVYDEFGKDHVNLTRMRNQVYRHVVEYLQPGARILELNAGTGTDAVHFARLGFSVHATDFAPGMVARIEEKIAQENLRDRMSVQQCSFTDLEQINAAEFD